MKKPGISRKTIIIVTLFWGMVLAIGGVLNGNQAIISPDMESLQKTVLEEKISSASLNCWITSQRSDFAILEFAESNECSTHFLGVNSYSCLNEKSLKNTKWVRNAFRKLDKQLIVFGATPEQSLAAASTLKLNGYSVRMLDRNQLTGLETPLTQSNYTIVQPVQQLNTTPASSPVLATSNNESDAPDEEEEGC